MSGKLVWSPGCWLSDSVIKKKEKPSLPTYRPTPWLRHREPATFKEWGMHQVCYVSLLHQNQPTQQCNRFSTGWIWWTHQDHRFTLQSLHHASAVFDVHQIHRVGYSWPTTNTHISVQKASEWDIKSLYITEYYSQNCHSLSPTQRCQYLNGLGVEEIIFPTKTQSCMMNPWFCYSIICEEQQKLCSKPSVHPLVNVCSRRTWSRLDQNHPCFNEFIASILPKGINST